MSYTFQFAYDDIIWNIILETANILYLNQWLYL